MGIKINIGKIFSTLIWGCIGAAVLVLLVAAIRYRNNNSCKGYLISLTGSCISKKDIIKLITTSNVANTASASNTANASNAPIASDASDLRNRPIQSFDLRRLESTLERNIWIQKARLFFDNNSVLHVDITERVPVTRIFTGDGKSFYFDSNGVKLPLLTPLPVRLPVFTGFPAARTGHRETDSGRRLADSSLTAGIRQISTYLRRDSFWMHQIAQININPDRSIELEPETGNQRIVFGDGNDVAAKFHRLELFYRQVLSKVGPERYQRIDVSYAGQVVATRKGTEERRDDSLQALNNIRQLIRSAQQMQPDTLRQQSVRPLETNAVTEQNLSTHDLLPATDTHKPKP
jgi:cell division protein FtsQ